MNYLRLSYLEKEAKLLENQIRETVNYTFLAVNLKITYSTRKPLNRIIKILTSDPLKCSNSSKVVVVCLNILLSVH